jgi:hypothetical protein
VGSGTEMAADSEDVPTNVEEVWFGGCHCGKPPNLYPLPSQIDFLEQ